jgi:hypothetical protein
MITKGYTFTNGETVTPEKLNDLVDDATIDAEAVGTTELAAGAVTAAKIGAGAVETAGIAAGAVTAAKIGAGAVETAGIAAGAVTGAKLSGAQTGSAPVYGARAWVCFDGARNAADTGASTNGANVKIFASGNVTSVLKNAVGDYTVTFTTAMPDADYAISMSAVTNASITGYAGSFGNPPTTKTTTEARVVTQSSGGGVDYRDISLVVYR